MESCWILLLKYDIGVGKNDGARELAEMHSSLYEGNNPGLTVPVRLESSGSPMYGVQCTFANDHDSRTGILSERPLISMAYY
jgi:hypothetical protein